MKPDKRRVGLSELTILSGETLIRVPKFLSVGAVS